jgi:hypothetical protein
VIGVRRVAAVLGGVTQRLYHVEVLGDRTRPPVRDDQRCGVRVRGTRVDEVDVDTIDGGQPLLEAVDPGLEASPVVLRAPVLADVLQVAERHPLRPVLYGLPLRPPGPGQALAEVGDVAIGDRDLERRHSACVRWHILTVSSSVSVGYARLLTIASGASHRVM